ncbi:MAG: maleylpyruvate isomerase family mycothiol-dependent enzyme [Actinomycetota bacterium]|nr:maleylpyruvate isomerase family mycothiol-dependent enzyme [Actinomycetota bacterium]
MDLLETYIAVWRRCATDLLALFTELDHADWDRRTDCPLWSVRDVVAHLAALESELADADPAHLTRSAQRTAVLGDGREVTSSYTERGVLARRGRRPAELVAEFEDAVHRRERQLAADPPTDPTGRPPVAPGGIGWDWQTLLRNRPIDLWVHEQDIRRAVRRPGNLDSPGARLATTVFGAALPMVVAKRASAPPGSTTVVDVTGPVAATFTVGVGADRRGTALDVPPTDPTTRLTMDTEAFTVLSTGRRDPDTLDVRVHGDAELAARVLRSMTVTA